ncbi:septal ring lytic transglycosylase RlpA family protein [Bradyrhizobium sp. CSS354]|nr:septal ring lytic transglycosylase RlpA family protein [Bradyrhizobium sp. CSS354]
MLRLEVLPGDLEAALGFVERASFPERRTGKCHDAGPQPEPRRAFGRVADAADQPPVLVYRVIVEADHKCNRFAGVIANTKAAHRRLPFGTKLRVTDLETNKSVVVRITDRGPWVRGRVLDLSLAAARSLGITNRGVTQVRAEVL